MGLIYAKNCKKQKYLSLLQMRIKGKNKNGGVAKSTSTINLAGVLAEMGKRVLVIDVDPQVNTTSGLGVNPAVIEMAMINYRNREYH